MNRVYIGQRIEAARQRAGLSTQDLADRIGKSQATISRIENGKQGVSIEILAEIGHVLRVHPFTLLTNAPLFHSVLLPPTSSARNETPMRILARTLECARLRAKLTSAQAAEALGVDKGELEAIELGYALPDVEMLAKMVDLYPVDAKWVTDLSRVEEIFPAVSERLAIMDHLLNTVLTVLRGHDKLLETTPTLRRLREDIETCLGVPADGAEACERKARYFSIGHLSDQLLKALQNPSFHERVETLARQWDEEGTPEEEKDGDTEEASDATMRDAVAQSDSARSS